MGIYIVMAGISRNTALASPRQWAATPKAPAHTAPSIWRATFGNGSRIGSRKITTALTRQMVGRAIPPVRKMELLRFYAAAAGQPPGESCPCDPVETLILHIAAMLTAFAALLRPDWTITPNKPPRKSHDQNQPNQSRNFDIGC